MEQPPEKASVLVATATAETQEEEPTEEEVAMIFRAVQDTFDEETATITKKKHNNVDCYKASLLNKVLSKFLDEYPSLLVGNHDSQAVAALPRKKKKTKIADEEAAVFSSRGNSGAVAGPSFRRLPLEAIALISSYGDRLDQNNLSLTSKRNYGVVNDRKRVTKWWPARKNRSPPFQSRLPLLVNETNGRIIKVVFSLDHSRVAVLKEGVVDHFPYTIEVWDRDKGLLAKLVSGRFRPDMFAFSPNGQFLVYTFTNNNRGDDEEWRFTKVCYLPAIGTDEEPIVSVLSFDNKTLIKAAFVNNAHFTFMTDRQEGVKLCWMWAEDGQVYFSPPTGILHDPDHPRQPPTIVAVASDKGSPVVYVYDSEDRTMVFRDLDRDVLVKKNLPPDYPPFTRSLTFSPDGNILVACNKDGCLSVFDFSDVDRIEDIDLGQHHRTVRFQNNPGVIDSFYGFSVSFTPNTSRSIITADFSELVSDEDDDEDGGDGGLRIRFCCRIIDLKNNELISDGWDESCWPLLVN